MAVRVVVLPREKTAPGRFTTPAATAPHRASEPQSAWCGTSTTRLASCRAENPGEHRNRTSTGTGGVRRDILRHAGPSRRTQADRRAIALSWAPWHCSQALQNRIRRRRLASAANHGRPTTPSPGDVGLGIENMHEIEFATLASPPDSIVPMAAKYPSGPLKFLARPCPSTSLPSTVASSFGPSALATLLISPQCRTTRPNLPQSPIPINKRAASRSLLPYSSPPSKLVSTPTTC